MRTLAKKYPTSSSKIKKIGMKKNITGFKLSYFKFPLKCNNFK